MVRQKLLEWHELSALDVLTCTNIDKRVKILTKKVKHSMVKFQHLALSRVTHMANSIKR